MNANEFEKNKEKKEITIKYLLYGLTGVVLLVALYNLYGNDCGFGIICFTLFFPFIPLQLVSFIVAGIKIAGKKNKTASDYEYLAIISLSIILCSWALAVSDSNLGYTAPHPNLFYIYVPTYCLSVALSIFVLLKKERKIS